eukprot:m.12052 g.12052  ORF g.12052 m.12052 type:complete len:80 (+) comp3944_c1_seq2:111-350(+)
MLGGIFNSFRAVVRIAPSISSRQMGTVIASEPTSFSYISLMGVLTLLTATITVGAKSAQSSVEYVEDNEIWTPEEDDDD